MKDLGLPKSVLGIKIEQTNEGLRLSQCSYFEKLLQRFEMDKCNPIATPMDSTPISVNNEEFENDLKLYRELVGCLMYGMPATRPDLSFTVNYVSRYQHEQTESRWKGLKRILRYIKGTLDLGLHYTRGEEILTCYADANYGSEEDRKSTSGFLIKTLGTSCRGQLRDKQR